MSLLRAPGDRLPLLFGALAACLVGLLAASWWAYGELLGAQRQRDHTSAVVAALAQLETAATPPPALVVCALNGGRPRPVRPPADPRPLLDPLLRLAADDPAQQRALAPLRTLLDRLHAEYTAPFVAACDGGRALPLADAARIVTDVAPLRRELLDTLSALHAAEQRQLAAREARLERGQTIAGLLFALFACGTVLMALVASLAMRASTRRLTDGNRELRREAAEREAAQEQVRASRSRLAMVLDHIPDAVLAFDGHARLQWVNPAAAAMFGVPADAAAGRRIAELVPELGAWLERPPTAPAAEPEAREVRRESMIGVQADGTQFPLEVAVVRTQLGGERIGVCLARDLREVERVARMKHEFVSMVSHELRTPLTSLRGSLSMLADGSAGELAGPVQRLVRLAHRNSERLVALVNDILDFEKLRAGELRVTPEPIDLVHAARSAIEANEGYAHQHDVNVVLVAPAWRVGAQADPLRLQQVLANLLSNAIKFTPRGGEVQIRVSPEGRVSVADEGPGVPPGFADRLFEPFAQADDLSTRRHGGTGLGLAISRGLMEQMGGAIGVEPPQAGSGAVFWIELPPPDGPLPDTPRPTIQAPLDLL